VDDILFYIIPSVGTLFLLYFILSVGTLMEMPKYFYFNLFFNFQGQNSDRDAKIWSSGVNVIKLFRIVIYTLAK
jgi:hypothetical protein